MVDVPGMSPNYNVRQVFSQNEEAMFADYLRQCLRLHHGSPPTEIPKIAYEFPAGNNKVFLIGWEENKSTPM